MRSRNHNKLISGLLVAVLSLSLSVPAYADVLVCQKESHVHTDECYKRGLICGLEETEGHHHGDDCYLVSHELACGIEAGTVMHTHTDACYTDKTVCACGLEETAGDPGHTHGESCYDEEGNIICGQTERDPVPGHSHTDACMKHERILTCTMSTEPHAHTDACWVVTKTLICQIPEQASHTHSESCYGRVGSPICGKKEHSHSMANGCYSMPGDGVESQEYWDEMMASVELSGDWSKDIVTVAKSQLGYKQSTSNFIYNYEGVFCGYNRYGHWYSLYRYGKDILYYRYEYWCADFASFCIHYAGIPEEAMPLNKNCAFWINELTEMGLFVPYVIEKDGSTNYTPNPGDLIFFEYNGDKCADHVGIVAEVDEEGFIHTIEGNPVVAEGKYPAYNWRIFGFGNMRQAYLDYQNKLVKELVRQMNEGTDESGKRKDTLAEGPTLQKDAAQAKIVEFDPLLNQTKALNVRIS